MKDGRKAHVSTIPPYLLVHFILFINRKLSCTENGSNSEFSSGSGNGRAIGWAQTL